MNDNIFFKEETLKFLIDLNRKREDEENNKSTLSVSDKKKIFADNLFELVADGNVEEIKKIFSNPKNKVFIKSKVTSTVFDSLNENYNEEIFNLFLNHEMNFVNESYRNLLKNHVAVKTLFSFLKKEIEKEIDDKEYFPKTNVISTNVFDIIKDFQNQDDIYLDLLNDCLYLYQTHMNNSKHINYKFNNDTFNIFNHLLKANKNDKYLKVLKENKIDYSCFFKERLTYYFNQEIYNSDSLNIFNVKNFSVILKLMNELPDLKKSFEESFLILENTSIEVEKILDNLNEKILKAKPIGFNKKLGFSEEYKIELKLIFDFYWNNKIIDYRFMDDDNKYIGRLNEQVVFKFPKNFNEFIIHSGSDLNLIFSETEEGKKIFLDLIKKPYLLNSFIEKINVDILYKMYKKIPEIRDIKDAYGNNLLILHTNFINSHDKILLTKNAIQYFFKMDKNMYLEKNVLGNNFFDIFKNKLDVDLLSFIEKELFSKELKSEKLIPRYNQNNVKKRKM